MSGNFVGMHFLTRALKPGRLHSITGLVCYKQFVEMDFVGGKNCKRHESAAVPQGGSACTLSSFVPA